MFGRCQQNIRGRRAGETFWTNAPLLVTSRKILRTSVSCVLIFFHFFYLPLVFPFSLLSYSVVYLSLIHYLERSTHD
jgi:hypothetical protein